MQGLGMSVLKAVDGKAIESLLKFRSVELSVFELLFRPSDEGSLEGRTNGDRRWPRT